MKNLLLLLAVLLTFNTFAQTTTTNSQFFIPSDRVMIVIMDSIPESITLNATTISGTRLIIETKIEANLPKYLLDILRKGGKFSVVATEVDGKLILTMPKAAGVIVYKGKQIDLKVITSLFIPDGLVAS